MYFRTFWKVVIIHFVYETADSELVDILSILVIINYVKFLKVW